MPKSLSSIGKDMDEDLALPGDAGYEPLTQTIRIGGVIERVPVTRRSDTEFDPEGVVDDDVLSDTRISGVGRHDPDGVYESPQSDGHNHFSEINGAIDELVNDNSEFYHVGWERDPEFVKVTTDLVESEYGFDAREIKRAIALR